jgi:hypothetical protein
MEVSMQTEQNEKKFYLHLDAHFGLGYTVNVVLGPWATKLNAENYSSHLTDSRIGEQLLNAIGVTKIIVQEA